MLTSKRSHIVQPFSFIFIFFKRTNLCCLTIGGITCCSRPGGSHVCPHTLVLRLVVYVNAEGRGFSPGLVEVPRCHNPITLLQCRVHLYFLTSSNCVVLPRSSGGEPARSDMVICFESFWKAADQKRYRLPMTGEDTGLGALASPLVGYLGKVSRALVFL